MDTQGNGIQVFEVSPLLFLSPNSIPARSRRYNETRSPHPGPTPRGRQGTEGSAQPGAALAADFGAEGLSSERVWVEAQDGPVVTLRGREPKKPKRVACPQSVEKVQYVFLNHG